MLLRLKMNPFEAFLFGFRLAGPHERQSSTEIISEMDQRKSGGRHNIRITA
jgi:hypothetical protein